jgi:ribose/xylose/arabinose/galactoside ABC-type transport system permease subunit
MKALNFDLKFNLKFDFNKVSGMLLAVWGLIAVFAIMAPGFASIRNVMNILKNTSVLLILACGMTMAIVSRNIDLSIGGVATYAGMAAAFFIRKFETPSPSLMIMAFLIAVAVGMAFGAFNGIMIGIFKYNYWLITFSTMNIGFALAQVITGGNIISGFTRGFRDIANSEQFILPGVVIFSIVVVLVMSVLTYCTRFGMHVYAIGDSEQCARQSGIKVERVRFFIYLLSGMLAGLGGILLASKTNSASPISGSGYEFDAIAAVVVGGTPFDGGRGGILRTVMGAISISAIKTGLQLVGLSNFVQQVCIGLIILAIIVFDVLSGHRRNRQKSRRVYK